MSVKLKIVDSQKEIEAKILSDIVSQIDVKMKKAAPTIKILISALIKKALFESDHAKSILSGKLQKDFGLTSSMAETALLDLTSIVSRNIIITISTSKVGSKLPISQRSAWSMAVQILPLGLPESVRSVGSYISEPSGVEINWMDWLLFKGVSILVEDFFVSGEQENFPSSRSGNGIMLYSGRKGRGFRVDPQYAGTESDNFVLQAMNSILPTIVEIMRRYLS